MGEWIFVVAGVILVGVLIEFLFKHVLDWWVDEDLQGLQSVPKRSRVRIKTEVMFSFAHAAAQAPTLSKIG
jgi:hypothetical protein